MATEDGGTPDAPDAGEGPCHATPAPCDALVMCSAPGDVAQCGACPAGFSGNGYSGCKPQLTNLEISAGTLVPTFSRETNEYTWVTGMAADKTNFTPSVSGGVSMVLDDAQTIQSGKSTDSIALLPYEERTRKLDLSAPNNRHTVVSLRTRRDWVWGETLRASNRDAEDEFGRVLSLAGNLLVVGARHESSNMDFAPTNNGALGSGAAYVFDLSGPAIKEVGLLKEEVPGAGHEFGGSVAATTDLIAVGAAKEGSSARGVNNLDHDQEAPGSDANAPRSGAVWVFAATGNQWQRTSYVKSDNSDLHDAFGSSVAMNDDWLIVGATGEASASQLDPSDNSMDSAGAAYVFKRTGKTFQQAGYLKAPHPSPGAQFGYSVALNQEFFAVGARADGDSGSVFLFRAVDGKIVFDSQHKASNADAGDDFGYSLAMSENLLVVGAIGEASDGTDKTGNGLGGAGAAYVFEHKNGLWSEVALLKSPRPREGDSFGKRVVICGDNIVIGSPAQDSSAQLLSMLDDETAMDSGALFVAAPGPWRIVSTLKPRVTQAGSGLGAVGCNDNVIVGGLSGESGVAPVKVLSNAGAVQVYR